MARTAPAAERGAPSDSAARTAAPAVWTWAANPWWEAMAQGEPAGEPAVARRSGWRRLLNWLIEYNRY